MPPPVKIGWHFPAGVPTFWAPSQNVGPPPIDGQGDSLCVVVYDIPLPSLQASRCYYYFSYDESQPPVVETNPHSVGRYTPARLLVSPLLYQTSLDQSQPPVVETQPHFRACYTPAKLTVSPLLYETRAKVDLLGPQSVGGGTYALPYVTRKPRIFGRPKHLYVPAAAAAAVAEAQPHFIGAFTPTRLYVSQLLYSRHQRHEFGPPVAETNVHTIGRFVPARLSSFAYNSWDQAQPPVVETNTHFIGRFISAKLTSFAYNSWDQSQPSVIETNVHTIGSFTPTKLYVQQLLYSRHLRHEIGPPVAETNIHSIGFFKNPPLWSFKFNSWDQSQPAVAETNVHFLAGFKPTKLIVSLLLYQQQTALDVPSPPQSVGAGTYALPYVSRRPRIFGRPKHIYVPLPPVVATAETQPHYLARYTSAKLTVWPLLWQQAEFQPPVVATNVHFVGKFTPAKLIQFAFNSWDTGVPQAETNTHWIGKFIPAKLIRFAYNSWDQAQPAVTETNVHYLATFKPTKFTIWPFLRQHADFQPPVVETNTNFLAAFKPVRLTISPELYRQQPALDVPPPLGPMTGAGFGLQLQFPRRSWIVNTSRYVILQVPPPQPETQPHYLARFTPVKLTVWPFLNSWDQGAGLSAPPLPSGAGTYALPYVLRKPRIFGRPKHIYVVPPTVGPTFETNPHFLGVFKPTKLYISQLLYSRHLRHDFGPPVVETNVHTIGRFAPVKLFVSPLLRQNTIDIPAPQPETQPHYLAAFKPAKLLVWPFLRSWDQAQPPVVSTPVHFVATFKQPPAWRFQFNTWDTFPPPVVEAQPHYLARFTPTKLTVWSGFRQHTDTGVSQVETNTHFIARFTPTKLISFGYNSADTGVSQVETNVHFLAKFSPTKFIRFAYNSWDFEPLQQETNPHFLGSFRQVPLWRFNYNTRGDDPAVVETQPHYLARYTPTRLSGFAFNSWDTSVPQVETNPHHVGRFTPTKLLRFNYNTRSDEPAQSETNPHSIGSFRPTQIAKLALLWNNPAADIYVAPTSAEPHFVSRFTPAKYISFRFNTPDTQVPPSVDFWVTAAPRTLIATADPRVLVATATARNLMAAGDQRTPIATGDKRTLFATGGN